VSASVETLERAPDEVEWRARLGTVGTAPATAPLELLAPAPFRPNAQRCRQARAKRSSCEIEAGRRTSSAVIRRRLLLGIVAVALLTALALPWGGTGGRTLAPPGSALAGGTLQANHQYVVQPGDTLWSIAVRLDPNGDPRPLVSELAARIGSDVVIPGERLLLP
jgi:hypothetical protein